MYISTNVYRYINYTNLVDHSYSNYCLNDLMAFLNLFSNFNLLPKIIIIIIEQFIILLNNSLK